MKQYFIRIDRWYYAKNQLEEASIEMFNTEFAHQLVEEKNLSAFWESLESKLLQLNKKHKRAKPLSLFTGTHKTLAMIGRSDRDIDGLIFIDTVKVKGTFLALEGMTNLKNPEKIDVFLGPPESGRTRSAKGRYPNGIFINGRSLVYNGSVSPFFLEDVTDETDAIIIDDLPLVQLQYVVSMFYVECLRICRHGRWPIVLPRPKIVVICEAENNLVSSVFTLLHDKINVTIFPLEGGDEA